MANYIRVATIGLLALLAAMAAPPASSAAAATSGSGTRYVQAASGSSLAFTFTQLGAASTGHFRSFATELQYDEVNLARSSLRVRVSMAGLDTQDTERDDTLKSADLFDAQTHPAATFVAPSLSRNAAGGLEAVGKLTIRGVSRDFRLPLVLRPTANGLELMGHTMIRRLDFGVGQGEWKSTESVGDEVKIEYKVMLVKAPG